MSKRPKGTGSLYVRKDGTWCAQYNGQYKYSKHKQTAKKKLTAMLKQAERIQPSYITVGTAIEQFLTTAKQRLKPRTLIRYQQVATVHLIPNIGRTKLQSLTPLSIEAIYIDMIGNGLAPATVGLTHAVLSSAVKRAVRLGLVETNVCGSVMLPKQRAKKVDVFTTCEVEVY